MGHPELLDRLAAHHLRQLRERISTKVSLAALTEIESVAYIDCRLRAQNASARIFDANAIKYLVATAAGIPRRLNVLCHNALLLAYSKNQNPVTLEVVREVVGDYKDIFLAPNNGPRVTLHNAEPAIHQPAISAPPIVSEEPADGADLAIRPRRRLALVGASFAACAVIGFSSVLIATTSNWSSEFDRMARRIAAAPASAEVSSPAPAADKAVPATLGYTAPIADSSAAPGPRLALAPAPAAPKATIQIHAGDTLSRFGRQVPRFRGSDPGPDQRQSANKGSQCSLCRRGRLSAFDPYRRTGRSSAVSKYYDAISRNLATTREPLAPARPPAKLVPKRAI